MAEEVLAAKTIWSSGIVDVLKVGVGGLIGFGASWLSFRFQLIRDRDQRKHDAIQGKTQELKDSIRKLYDLSLIHI